MMLQVQHQTNTQPKEPSAITNLLPSMLKTSGISAIIGLFALANAIQRDTPSSSAACALSTSKAAILQPMVLCAKTRVSCPSMLHAPVISVQLSWGELQLAWPRLQATPTR